MRERADVSTDRGPRSPELSVIIPQAMTDVRADLRLVEEWTRRQSCPPDRYEVIVAMKAGDAAAAAEVRSYLRPHDPLIIYPGESETQYYALAAQAAKGRLFLFTENHTSPDHHCVAETLKFMAGSGFRAASLRSDFIDKNYFAHMEAHLYRQDLAEKWLSGRDWRQVRLRGFAIDRDLYFELGGWAWQYGLFCEDEFALRLAQRQVKVGYAEQAIVRHINTSELQGLGEDITDFVEGECAFRDSEAGQSSHQYLGEPPLWRQRATHLPGMRAAMARALARTMLSEVWRPGGLWFALACWPRLVRLAGTALLGSPSLLAPAWLAVYWQRFLCWLWQSHPTRGVQAFQMMWYNRSELARLRYYLRNPVAPGSTLGQGLDFASAGPEQLVGFHEVQQHQARAFRWTEPVAVVRFRLSPAAHQVEIDTGTLRAGDFPLACFVNGQRVPRSSIRRRQGLITFSIAPEWLVDGEQRLMIVAAPLAKTASERRRVALPVFSLKLVPQAAVVSRPEAA